jgi:hypothetical protein
MGYMLGLFYPLVPLANGEGVRNESLMYTLATEKTKDYYNNLLEF